MVSAYASTLFRPNSIILKLRTVLYERNKNKICSSWDFTGILLAEYIKEEGGTEGPDFKTLAFIIPGR